MDRFTVVDPATGMVGDTYPTIDDDEVREAISLADDAYRSWGRATDVETHTEVLRRVARLHVERRERLADIIVREMGKPRTEALGEIDFCAGIYSYYADHAAELLADRPLHHFGDGHAVIRSQPIGVLLGIMPWNFPFYQVARFVAPSLAVGNAILLKHAPQCPQSALAIQQICDDAGVPKGMYTNIFVDVDQIDGIIADRRVQGVSLTGSGRAGAAVAQLAGKYLKKVVLELGGSDPFIVLSTDDMDATVEAAAASRLRNTGQSCAAAKRFIVLDTLYDEFVDKLTAHMQTISPGDPTAAETVIGPLSSVAASDRLAEQIRRAAAGGATVVGGRNSGTHFQPGVITDLSVDNDAFDDELFGPIASVFAVSCEEEAIDLANNTPFGLGSYVFTTDREQAQRVADALDVGMVYINLVNADSPDLPFGGVKQSGFGRELGPLGILEFTNRKMVLTHE